MPQNLVNNQPFFGRDEEQEAFRMALREGFLPEALQTRLRQEPWVKRLLEQVTSILRERVEALEQNLSTIEERCQDEAWIKAVQDEIYYLFWQDEEAGWRAFAPRIVEALAYSDQLWYGLLEVAQGWQKTLSTRGQKRLKMLQKFTDSSATLEDKEALLKELKILGRRGWLAGPEYAERRAILALQHGQLLVKRYQYDRANHFYEKVERDLPAAGKQLKEQLAEALYELAGEWICPSSKNWLDAIHISKAVRLLEKVLAWQPEKQEAWYRLGLAQSKRGKPIKAIAAYQRAIELDSTDADSHHGLGKVYHAMERVDDAVAAYQQAIQLNRTDDARYHNHLADLYREFARVDEAIAVYQQAIQLKPTDRARHKHLINLYCDLERVDDAIAAYQQLIQLSTMNGNDASYHYRLGNLYRSQGCLDLAIVAYQQAIKLRPTSFIYVHRLANLYRSQERIDEAQATYLRAISLDPRNEARYPNLAQVIPSRDIC